ncbi:MAG: sulfatase-like hydrolase/transferase [Patescibacteria group bacterium]|nr:sulfatase-like hydrolase/transferase [Patescibacteria group bacterium]
MKAIIHPDTLSHMTENNPLSISSPIPDPPLKPPTLFSHYGLFIFFAVSISYFELVYGLWTFGNINTDYIFAVLFSLPAATVFFLLSVLFSKRINKIVAVLITLFLILMYGGQLIYHYTFHTPFPLYSLIGAEGALQFLDVIKSAILKNSAAIFLFFLPILFLLFFGKHLRLSRPKPQIFFGVLLIGVISYIATILGIHATQEKNFSQYAVYYNIASPELSVRELGVLTTMRLDLMRLAFGFEEKKEKGITSDIEIPTTPPVAEAISSSTHNILDIDFKELIDQENNPTIRDMHTYFSSIVPEKKNSRTGMFEGNNLIFIVAESFSPYAMDPTLTPTLYAMSHEGFVFNNFYNPVWGVSTSDGEYVSDMGLLPKSGVWSMLQSAKNYLPFALGNQFKKLGYLTKAFHNHTYTYYGRNVSMPNLGYDYKGIGNGLRVRKTWPESDLEMIEVTANDYIVTSTQPFHTYYMTMSGHMNYNFYGNYISAKNKSAVEQLPYSEASRAYIAANLELEFAIQSLIEKLEKAGVLDNTVIALVNDHYPYGLPKESIDELAGHTVEENFELYKSVFILWKKGMDIVTIDTPVSTLDILPTISNLFGLEYDSRLLMGRDVFSDASPLVIFLNRSWITDKEKYNSTIASDDGREDTAYEKTINDVVANEFTYSAKILENDYYGKTIPK